MKTNVTFPSNGLNLAGHLYTPDDHDGGRLPAVVVGHPFTGVKEQTAGLYAQRLAEQGFIALAYDAAYGGGSEGEPRGLENPFQRAEDVKAAVSYLSTRDDVDPERIGALGVCASGGYVPFAAQSEHRIKAVATVSAVDTTSLVRDGVGRTDDGSAFRGMLEQAGALRTQEALGKPTVLVSALPDAVDPSMPTLYQECFDYYRTSRGRHPRSTNQWVMRSVDQMAPYDSYAMIDAISPRPLLMIVGSEADTAYFSREAIAKASEPKEFFVIDGATHVDLYDKDEYVTPAIAKLADFFARNLPA
ncbi:MULTISPECIES: alpha/beta hydrolase [Streptomyces]|uniref:Alpha/beta hydrolase n=2 Tax=Streptomyces TaxID=1883 RepID=A0ABV9IHS5_9ACTN